MTRAASDHVSHLNLKAARLPLAVRQGGAWKRQIGDAAVDRMDRWRARTRGWLACPIIFMMGMLSVGSVFGRY